MSGIYGYDRQFNQYDQLLSHLNGCNSSSFKQEKSALEKTMQIEVFGTPPNVQLNLLNPYLFDGEAINNIDPAEQGDFFDAYALTSSDLNEDVTYLVDDFLVEQSITMIFAKASQGKSYFVLFLALMLLQENKLQKCVYLDMDNGKKALKSRGLDGVLDRNEKLAYIHRSKLKGINHIDMLDRMVSEAREDHERFKGYLFVIDSIRDFLSGRDMNKDKDIIPLMEQLKALRDAGGTIIFLHHSTKEREGNYYKGTTTFIDSIDVAYGLKKTEIERHKITSYALTVEKDRIAVDNAGFELNTETGVLINSNYDVANMDEDESEFVAAVRNVLDGCETITQSKLLEEIGSDTKATRKRLHKFVGVFWNAENGGQNNAMWYSKK